LPDRARILIVTGHDHYHHRWREASTHLRALLEGTDIFDVKITEEFTGAGPETLASYDAVVLDYFGARSPSQTEARWGDRAEAALFEFVRSGKGVVFYHSSFWVGRSWNDAHGDEIWRLAGGLLGPQSRRAPEIEWPAALDDAAHPIVRGLPLEWRQVGDDKYVNLRWHADADPYVLASIYDDPDSYLNGAYYAVDADPGPPLFDPDDIAKLPGVGRRHPVAWTNDFGAGRVFALAFGHIGHATIEAAHLARDTGEQIGPTLDTGARTQAFVTMFTRGAEWAATGAVTLPVSAEWEPHAPSAA
jgi:type 1 glutamine amidotransferase